ncbi:AMIN-like domain-containing (lipo)protein [Streptomyces albidochromogenes]|uniref:AMIN-like domain-containing protein n=1 Tax=Streptomyces albidochromogenes TaxID=329524 RepID=A0ABW6FG07_9ACTN
MGRKRAAWATVVALVAATSGVAAVPAAATTTTTTQTTYCPTGWGSTTKTRSAATMESVTNVRTGRHACFDRMVVDVPGAATSGLGYSVRYVSRVHQDGSGKYIPVGGGAVLEVRVMAPAYDAATGKPTYPVRAGERLKGVDLSGYRTFRDARFAGSFEGETQIGLGVRARLPFRVSVATDRVVIDVAHNWTGAR